jgi:hypothetical protein
MKTARKSWAFGAAVGLVAWTTSSGIAPSTWAAAADTG